MNVVHDQKDGRFLVEKNGRRSMLQYEMLEGGVMHLIRTWVDPAERGRGIGARLVRAALDHARARGYRVTTSCWFVDEFLERTPEYKDLRA